MYSKVSPKIVFADCGEKVVIAQNLAMTPSMIAQCVDRGMPVNTMNLAGQYYDGLPAEKLSFEIPVTDIRGVDTSDVWQAEKSSRRKLKDLHRIKLSKVQQRASMQSPMIN